ncbi:MAG: hypothetical protein HOP96_02870 [Sphingomonas sp.]|nr:hypothetical protein [Sphingomonas sp.]
MSLFLAALMQTASAGPPEVIDLTISQPCQQKAEGDEVVVCANRGESPYRLPKSAPRASKPAKAEVQIADGVSAGAETENVDVGGFPSNRLMLRFKMKF